MHVVGEVKDEEMAVRARVRLRMDGLRKCLRHMRLRWQATRDGSELCGRQPRHAGWLVAHRVVEHLARRRSINQLLPSINTTLASEFIIP